MALQSKAAAIHRPGYRCVDSRTGLGVVLFECSLGLASHTCRDATWLCAWQRRCLPGSEESRKRIVMECCHKGISGRNRGCTSMADWRDALRGLGAIGLGACECKERIHGQVNVRCAAYCSGLPQVPRHRSYRPHLLRPIMAVSPPRYPPQQSRTSRSQTRNQVDPGCWRGPHRTTCTSRRR